MSKKICILMMLLSFNLSAFEQEVKEPPKTEGLVEHTSKTSHSITIDGKKIPYQATAGNMILKDENGKDKASISYVAYTKEGVEDTSTRPITFCFNGGPGSSSVWLHIGTFGPRRIYFDENCVAEPPYEMVDNEHSLLDVTDLVFIDPVSTGHSRPAPGEDAKQFHGVEEDVKSVGEFVRLYIKRNQRWDSPKYLAGESYGTIRAASLAAHLHDTHYVYLNGIILISTVLNYQTMNDPAGGNDLPYILYLPTYTTTALYHERLSPEYQKDRTKTMDEVQKFALGEYTLALMQGDSLNPKQRQDVIEKLSRYTGLSKDFIDRSNLRINSNRFEKELLRNEKRTVGRFDSRLKGIDSDASSSFCEYDPSLEAVLGAFTAGFNHYLSTELKLQKDEDYKILTSVSPWNFSKTSNQFLYVGDSLREVMTKNPHLKVFVGSGYYDLATPYFATIYTFNHLGLDPELQPHITMKYYDGGHMMYLYYPALEQLKKDLASFINAK